MTKVVGVDPVCRVLELSPTAYFARKKRPKSARRLRDEQLMPLIEEIHGSPGRPAGPGGSLASCDARVHEVARCAAERLMAELGMEGVIRGGRCRTTVPEPTAPRPPDLVDGDLTACRPDRSWAADTAYVRPGPAGHTWRSSWTTCSRVIVGWQVANHTRTELPLQALEMALREKTKKHSGLIHHSDRGSQYVSIRYTERLAEVGASASVGSVADSYDNAMAEALNGTFKAELIEHQGPWQDFDEVERAVFQWVAWYNGERLHSALGYVPPDEYEQAYWAQPGEAPQTA